MEKRMKKLLVLLIGVAALLGALVLTQAARAQNVVTETLPNGTVITREEARTLQVDYTSWPIVSETMTVTVEAGELYTTTTKVYEWLYPQDLTTPAPTCTPGVKPQDVHAQSYSLHLPLITKPIDNCFRFIAELAVESVGTQGPLHSHIVHYVTKLSNSAQTQYTFRPHGVDLWWTRDIYNEFDEQGYPNVSDAYLLWGCEGCLSCADKPLGKIVYEEYPHYSPTWYTLQTSVYRYTSSGFPGMKPVGGTFAQCVMANVHSKANVLEGYSFAMYAEVAYCP